MATAFPSAEYREMPDNGRGFVVGLVCGAAIGTAIGLLFAPKPGDELRGQIASSAGRVRRRANDTYTRAAAAVSDLADRGRDAVRQGRETLEDAQAAFSQEMADGRLSSD
jgi:gas vesicle protein